MLSTTTNKQQQQTNKNIEIIQLVVVICILPNIQILSQFMFNTKQTLYKYRHLQGLLNGKSALHLYTMQLKQRATRNHQRFLLLFFFYATKLCIA